MATEKKRKDCTHKNPAAREEWNKRKREGRHKQVYVDTSSYMSIEEFEALSDAEILALPAPHWEKEIQ
jgi:hypothetical protein